MYGFWVEIVVVFWEVDDVLKVFFMVFFWCGLDWVIFVVEDGIVCEWFVEIGWSNGFEIEIVFGLVVGDIIIFYLGGWIIDGVVVI